MSSEQYSRYQADAAVLALIGECLVGQAADAVRLPGRLADAALAAWLRDELEELAAESEEQRDLREAAAVLALIGCAVQRSRATATTLALDAQEFAAAVRRAGHL